MGFDAEDGTEGEDVVFSVTSRTYFSAALMDPSVVCSSPIERRLPGKDAKV